MKTIDLTSLLDFTEGGSHRETLATTDKLWSEVICLDAGQQTGSMSDPDADALLVVMAGEVVVHANKRRTRMKQWEAVILTAGSNIHVKSASSEPSVVLVVTAPPPTGLEDEASTFRSGDADEDFEESGEGEEA